MKAAWVMASILMAGWGSAALAQTSPQECNKTVAERLKTCLEKAPSDKEKQTCKTLAQQAQQKCKAAAK